MFERILKDLANRHFEVIWRYENMTNSIMVRLENGSIVNGTSLNRKLDSKTLRHPICPFLNSVWFKF